jgi:predicted lipid-binding transport protein (Tim44 family)
MFFCVAIGLLYFWHDTAEAARMGGGRSFGSRPSYQRSAPPPSQSPTSPQAMPGQTAQPRPMGAPAQSPFGRWGGMLGGMLMGGMIGSLLFGGGHGAGGPGLLDLLIIGGGLFLLMRFLRARRTAAQSQSASGPASFERRSTEGWANSGFSPTAEPEASVPVQPSYPPGFNAEEFLKGAGAIYTRLQTSWDKRQLDDIRQFTSPEVYKEIEDQARQDPTPGKTELLLINPKIIEVREVGAQTVVSVLYDVMMREDSDAAAKQVRELWHFSRDTNSPQAFWLLEGIQQIES